MKRFLSALLGVLTGVSSLFAFSSCKEETGFKRDEKYLLGLCEATYEINDETENTLTRDYVSKVAGTFGAKSYRLWMHFNRILKRDANSNEVRIVEDVAEEFHQLIASLKAQGVERFIGMTCNYLHPYGYDPSIAAVVPDPLTEPSEYREFLELFEESFRVLAEEFPEIDYFEPTNEPDLDNGQNLCKNGYVWGGSANDDYVYSEKDGAHIVADLCWYATQGVKEVDENNVVILPALCGYSTTVNYLEAIYQAIDSKALPTGEEKADVNPDNYFEILNWHPYLLGSKGAAAMDGEWLRLQKRIYAVAEKYGDGAKPVWFTEMGFTDRGNGATAEKKNAEDVVKFFNYVKKDLPFVETVYFFRITNLEQASISSVEDNFGLFRSKNEATSFAGEPKPIAVALYQWFKGKGADLTPLYSL